MKFPLANAAGSIKIGGMYNEATINFESPSIAPTGSTGDVRLYSKSGREKWAILLPQNKTVTNVVIGGTEYPVTVPPIAANALLNESISEIQNTSTLTDLSTLTDNYEAQDGDILTGALAGNYKITVADGATVTLSDATITYSDNSQEANNYAGITCLGDATLVLEGTNTVQAAFYHWPAVFVVPNKTLTIRGEGTLNASTTNGAAAAIGAGLSSVSGPSGNIVIESGTINATAVIGPAIGGGNGASCGTITIIGGTINATSNFAAGIGGGQGNGAGGDITISGGNVTAVSNGNGAGIGSGSGRASCGVITISGGTVNATASNATGIGAGMSNTPCSAINILGGNITAKSNNSGAGIGAGLGNSSCGAITISGNATIVDASSNGTGIGAGVSNFSCGAITIDGGNITATSKYNAGIDSGQGTATCNGITINGGTINATSPYGVGIGSASNQSCGSINITGADVTAVGAYAGIGAQSGTSVCSGINISNSTVYAKGKEANYGCGIGISMGGTIGPITIADDVELTAIKATGADKCIGKGYSSSDPTIGTITVGGTVYPNGVDANQADGLTFVYPVTETTITWNSSFISSISHSQFDDDASVSQDGITASFTFGVRLNNSELIIWSSPDNQLTFSSTVGNISKIEIYVDDVENMPEDQGWTFDGTKMTWEGTPASSVTLAGNSSFGDDIYVNYISQIVFTVQ